MIGRIIGIVATVVLTGTSAWARSQYPLAFTSSSSLKQLGVALGCALLYVNDGGGAPDVSPKLLQPQSPASISRRRLTSPS
jgi:hypothetical protein